MDDCTEASLISKLECSDYTNLHSLFSRYLHPLSLHLPNSKIPSTSTAKSSESKPIPSSSPPFRVLLKSYLPFLKHSLSFLFKCLSDSAKPSDSDAAELFNTYRLCLDCFRCSSSLLSPKPYSVHLHTARFIRRLVEWGWYEEAMDEGFGVLKAIAGMKSDVIVESSMGFVPVMVAGKVVDGELARLVVEVVVRVFDCVALSKTNKLEQYKSLLPLLDEIQPWLRTLETSMRKKVQRKLLSNLNKATMFLAREIKEFGAELFPQICAATFNEYQKLLREQSAEVHVEKLSAEFLELLSHCAYECRASCVDTCSKAAASMYKVDIEPFALISSIYATGLLLSGSRLQICCNGDADFSILEGKAQVQKLNSLLNDAEKFFALCSTKSDKRTKFHVEESRKGYLKFYLDALKFLCQPLAVYVNLERKNLLNQVPSSSVEDHLHIVQKAFYQLCDICFHRHSCSLDTERDGSDEIDETVLQASIASVSLSLKLNSNKKKSWDTLEWLLSEERLQCQGLKFLIFSLYDIADDCYIKKQLKESLEAIKLCFEASWTRGIDLCRIFADRKGGSGLGVSEDAILDIANKACEATSFFLHLLSEGDHDLLGNTIVYSLRKWSTMSDLFEKLPSPQKLVKKWVEIQFELYRGEGIQEDAPSLYSYLVESVQDDGFLSFSLLNVSKGKIDIILELELLAYQELTDQCPEFCGRMRMKIIDVLLSINGDDWFKKSSILVRKGRLFMESEIEALNNPICCLSEAIDTILSNIPPLFLEQRGLRGGTHQSCILASNRLAVAYSLRALAMHEAEPGSKKVLDDIEEAVKIWLNHDVTLETSNHLGDIFQLLYHILDLLSLRGNVDPDVCDLLIKRFSGINKPLDKCLLMLWESRRLSHALCFSPINEAFLLKLSKDYGDNFKSLQCWLSFMMESQLPLLSFKQNFSIHCTQFPQVFGWGEHTLSSNVTVNDIKEVAVQLISNGRKDATFLVGYLYYDLAERFFSIGQPVEALHWAEEAHQLRWKLVEEHFSYVLEYPEERSGEHGEPIRNQSIRAKYFRVFTHVAIKVWPGAASFDSEGCSLTPWKVLQCYLESNLQVGNIQEVIGNGPEAEALFCWGKSISCLQGLSLFNAAFSAGLGKVYHKMLLWELAEEELQSAKKILVDSREPKACLSCCRMMESNVNELLGNLYRSSFNSSREGSCAGFTSPGELYKTSLAILNSIDNRSDVHTFAEELSGSLQSLSKAGGQFAKPDNRRSSRKEKELNCLQSGNCPVTEQASKMRCSRNRSSQCKGCIGGTEDLDLQKDNCLECFPVEVKKFDSLRDFIYIKWELARRRHLLRVLIGLGKWEQDQTEVHASHKIYSHCVSILICRNPFCDCSHSSCTHGLELINVDVSEDTLAVERAAVLYDLCMLSLKNIVPRENRTNCCYLGSIEVSDIVSLLMRCFILCREVPLLFQKVCRLLATMNMMSTCNSKFSFSMFPSSELSENHWAAYFHQASIGAHYNYWVLSSLAMKNEAEYLDAKDPQVETDGVLADIRSLFRLAPDSVDNVAAFVNDFFMSLPTTTIVCLSILGGSYASLLKELIPYSSSCSWMLVSHFNANSQPVVVLLPVNVINQEPNWIACSSESSSLVDVVAPIFKSILRENVSSAVKFSGDARWMRRKELDGLLSKFLRDMEESWFGPWKFLFRGQWSERQALESVVRKLGDDLKDKCGLDVKESLLKAVLGAVELGSQDKFSIPRVLLEKGCYVVNPEACDLATCDTVYGANQNSGESICPMGLELMLAAFKKLEEEHGTNRESIILVLGSEMQALPFENMPILRDREVYRMPSISSISALLQKTTMPQQGAGPVDAVLPLIDPLDAFYLVNPSGDLADTQAKFEEWFRRLNLEGKAGIAPTTEELLSALKSHDVFLYFGHGSGAQYIPMQEIQKLDKCAASVLMGCSSGSLQLNGSYNPRGIAYSYISAGSPVVIANLWEVTEQDAYRFGRAVLEAWIAERSKSLVHCIQCSMLAAKMTALSWNKKTQNGKEGRGKKQTNGACHNTSVNWCTHKEKVGYFVSKARNACKLRYLIGAAPVCYGVPTGIRKKNDTCNSEGFSFFS